MRYQGKVVKWNDDKGFGFILPNGGGIEVFLHISAFSSAKKRPEINQLISYTLDKDKSGRIKASHVAYVTVSNNYISNEEADKINPIFIVYMLLFIGFISERAMRGFLPHFFPFIFVGANLIVFLYYYQDKTAAIKGQWRTPESTLHLFGLIGGWGGAYIAQRMFHHKYKKTRFMSVYVLTVLINCILIIVFAMPELRSFLMGKLS